MANRNQEFASAITGHSATVLLVSGFAAIPLAQWCAGVFGKKAALQGVMAIYFFSSISTLVTFNPAFPYLMLVNVLFTSVANTAIWVLIPSMTADVADYDELRTGERREGSFASVFSWIVKLALSLAIGFSGALVGMAGFDAGLKTVQPPEVLFLMRILLATVPLAFLGAAFFIAAKFPLSGTEMRRIRDELDGRRSSEISEG